MRIGIDISQIVYEGTGVARFTRGLVDAIIAYDSSNEWIFFFSSLRQCLDADLEKRITQKGYKIAKWHIPPTLLSWYCNTMHSLSPLIPNPYSLFPTVDWFITSDWIEPSLSTKKATIVHDLVFIRHPESVSANILSTQKKRLALVQGESDIIFTDSEMTKTDLMKSYPLSYGKIIVNYPGVTVLKPSEMEMKQTLMKFSISRPFILAVGKIEPRKNLSRLIEAFHSLKRNDIELIIAGPDGWTQFDDSRIKHYENIRYLGMVTDTELFALYGSSLGFVFPSLWEGFGYPLIEAMLSKVPVACSNTSSLKELGGKNVILFEPTDVTDIARAVDELIMLDKNKRKKLIEGAGQFAEIFTWRKYYNTLIQSFK